MQKIGKRDKREKRSIGKGDLSLVTCHSILTLLYSTIIGLPTVLNG